MYVETRADQGLFDVIDGYPINVFQVLNKYGQSLGKHVHLNLQEILASALPYVLWASNKRIDRLMGYSAVLMQ